MGFFDPSMVTAGHLQRLLPDWRCPGGKAIYAMYRKLDDLLDEQETLQRLCGSDPARRRIVHRVMRRLRRNEHAAGTLRRLSWRLLTKAGPGER